MDDQRLGQEAYNWAKELFPICRSLTGEGTRQTLSFFQKQIPFLTIKDVPSGTAAADWTIPDEWNIKDAFVKNSNGERIIDFQKHNLHVMGYSTPIHKKMGKTLLEQHLFSLPEQPDAIPYVTSYYSRNWGFCLKHEDRLKLPEDEYEVCIDSELKPGVMNYADCLIPGESEKEILLSSYVCHPSMGNNELSGPCVLTALAKWIMSLPKRKYSYRIIFIPETIGSIYYISQHAQLLKERTIAGYVLSCVGDERCYSFMPSRTGNTLADKVARSCLRSHAPNYISYPFLKRGSDERQYCTPRLDLPVCSVMRSKYGEYPEYHTSLDDLNLISPKGLGGSIRLYQKMITTLEHNAYPVSMTLGEPQLGRRGLYPNTSQKEFPTDTYDLVNAIAYADGIMDMLDIAETIGCDVEKVIENFIMLEKNKLVKIFKEPLENTSQLGYLHDS